MSVPVLFRPAFRLVRRFAFTLVDCKREREAIRKRENEQKHSEVVWGVDVGVGGGVKRVRVELR